MLAAIGTDRERALATQMAQRVNVSVLQANNIKEQKSAIEALNITQEDIESFRRVASDEKEPDDPLTDDRHGPGNNRQPVQMHRFMGLFAALGRRFWSLQ